LLPEKSLYLTKFSIYPATLRPTDKAQPIVPATDIGWNLRQADSMVKHFSTNERGKAKDRSLDENSPPPYDDKRQARNILKNASHPQC